jgi:hypothetical protein
MILHGFLINIMLSSINARRLSFLYYMTLITIIKFRVRLIVNIREAQRITKNTENQIGNIGCFSDSALS